MSSNLKLEIERQAKRAKTFLDRFAGGPEPRSGSDELDPVTQCYTRLVEDDRMTFDESPRAAALQFLAEKFGPSDLRDALDVKSARLALGIPAIIPDDPDDEPDLWGSPGTPADTDAVKRFESTRIGTWACLRVPTSETNLVAAANHFVFKHAMGSKKREAEIRNLVWDYAKLRVQVGTDPDKRLLKDLTRDEKEVLMYSLRIAIVSPNLIAASNAIWGQAADADAIVKVIEEWDDGVMTAEHTRPQMSSVVKRVKNMKNYPTLEKRFEAWLYPPQYLTL